MRNIGFVDAGLSGKIDGLKEKECIEYMTRLLLLFRLGVILSLIVLSGWKYR
jgi:hypothetical protein